MNSKNLTESVKEKMAKYYELFRRNMSVENFFDYVNLHILKNFIVF